MADRLQCPVPSCPEFWNQVVEAAPFNPKSWEKFLGAREIDTLKLRKFALRRGIGQDINPPLHWDLSHSVWMPRNKSMSTAGVLPCISKGHTIWDVQRQVPWLGFELLMAQGFPRDVQTIFQDTPETPNSIRRAIKSINKTSVSDCELRQLAGNTMTVPVMMLLQVAHSIHIRSIPFPSSAFHLIQLHSIPLHSAPLHSIQLQLGLDRI